MLQQLISQPIAQPTSQPIAQLPPQSIQFSIVQNTIHTNDLTILKDLTQLKILYSRQLVKMPRQYIMKLLFDTIHQSLLLKTHAQISNALNGGITTGKISAGLTFRTFPGHPYCEIAFLAVSKLNQYSGLGSKLMNKFKNHCQSQNIQHIFTFADNTAIPFFQKHGFSKQISLPESMYKPFIKEYIGGQLMECKLNLNLKIDFETLKNKLKNAQNIIVSEVKNLLSLASYDLELSARIVKKTQKRSKSLTNLSKFIPGIKQTGYSKQNQNKNKKLTLHFLLQCHQFVQIAYDRGTLLNDFIEYDDEGKPIQSVENVQKLNTQKRFYLILYQIERKLIQGHFHYKDQLTQYFTDQMKLVLTLNDKLRENEKEFLDKLNQLKYDFIKNTLQQEKPKTKPIEIPKIQQKKQKH